ncbi:MAG: type II toxin-antitoxin system RelE/ParE family toxin [Patescibacteria group bacterium]
MKIFFKPSFIKDLEKIPLQIRSEIKIICFQIFPAANNLKTLKGYSIKPLSGFKHYYRLRFGEYRIGFKNENNEVIFMRVKNRKDIYKYFP